MAVFLIVVGAVGILSLRAQAHFNSETRQLELDRTVWRTTHRVLEELRAADPATVLPLNLADSHEVRYQRVEGYASGARILSPEQGISFGLVAGEFDNNIDDNGDGRIDEGRLLLDTGTSWKVLAENVVDARFHRTATGVEFEVTAQIVDRDGTVLERRSTVEATHRN